MKLRVGESRRKIHTGLLQTVHHCPSLLHLHSYVLPPFLSCSSTSSHACDSFDADTRLSALEPGYTNVKMSLSITSSRPSRKQNPRKDNSPLTSSGSGDSGE